MNASPKYIGKFNGFRVYDLRETSSLEGMEAGDLYIDEYGDGSGLYAYQLKESAVWGIDFNPPAQIAFVLAADHLRHQQEVSTAVSFMNISV